MSHQHKFSVKTIDDSGMVQVATDLNSLVFKDFIPDIIIGIRSGGYIVAEIMAQKAAHKPKLLAISRQRSGTKTKSKIAGLKTILGMLPYAITNQIRIIEHKILTSKPAAEPKIFEPDAGELEILRSTLKQNPQAKILIVDDAIDSGATMKAVLDLVKKEADSSCIIKTASVTVTTSNPLINPDYSLYRYVLCRFSWAFDFKH